jgi:FKBP-type peptidyl-prolyl cis-trans isomerase
VTIVFSGELAYGERGSPPKIPGNSALVFTIEMIEIQGEKAIALKCNVGSLEDCDDRMKAYIQKTNKKYGGDKDEIEEEIQRLMGMNAKSMKEDLRVWIDTRIFLLQQMIMISNAKDDTARAKEEL